MLLLIKRSAMEFCTQQLQQKCINIDNEYLGKQFISSINVQISDIKHTIYIGINKELLQDIYHLFFEDDEHPSQNDLIDMLLETVNMIVGHAKTMAQEIEYFVIDIPRFINYEIFNYLHTQKICLNQKNKYLTIAIKEHNK